MGGMGGGHATAAGANVKGEPNEALKRSMRIIREILDHKAKAENPNKTNVLDSSQTQVVR